MNSFTFATSQSILVEAGAAKRLGQICVEREIRSLMLVTDPGIERLGLHETALGSLREEGIRVELFGAVVADPPEEVVEQALLLGKETRPDAIVGFGGGSSMDVAKIVALLVHPECQQELGDIYGVGNARGRRLPLIQIPTTAGTGSEVTQVAIVTTGETTKMGAVTPLFLPDLAILDAELTLGLPPAVTAATGVDAMVHAIEAYTSKIKKNPLSDLVAKQALSLMTRNIHSAVHEGSDLAAREAMLLGAMLAGQAFANAPVGAVHALAYPLGGHFHIPHGLSNSLVLPHVMRFNADEQTGRAAQLYAELAPIIMQRDDHSEDAGTKAAALISYLEALIDDLQLPNTLREMNIGEEFLDTLASDAMLQQRLLMNNPREVNYADALAIYRAAY